MVTESALPLGSLSSQTDREEATETTGETTPHRDQQVRWTVVAYAHGLADAAIIAGRLEAEGVPARIHQEPAGVAIGLTMGLLGEATVLVPEPLVERAQEILSQPVQELDEAEGVDSDLDSTVSPDPFDES